MPEKIVPDNLAVVGDIGGTNARFAIVEPGSTQLQEIQVLPCSDYPNLDDAFREYLAQKNIGSVATASIAFACPVHTDTIKMTNNHWVFSRSEIQRKLGLKTFKCINDFTAMALGVPHLSSDQLVTVGQAAGNPESPRLVIGPGTGLGVSGLVKTSAAWVPLATEGGHVDFAPVNDQQMAVLKIILNKYSRVSVERLLCGEGLVNIYKSLTTLHNTEVKYGSPAGITHAAVEEGDEIAVATLNFFCEVFGQVCGNAALTIGALGGVYICGGIIPRFLDFFVASNFRAHFEDKGRMRGYMESIPVFVVTETYTGLLGAAEAVNNIEVQG
jgi:glucokinase